MSYEIRSPLFVIQRAGCPRVVWPARGVATPVPASSKGLRPVHAPWAACPQRCFIMDLLESLAAQEIAAGEWPMAAAPVTPRGLRSKSIPDLPPILGVWPSSLWPYPIGMWSAHRRACLDTSIRVWLRNFVVVAGHRTGFSMLTTLLGHHPNVCVPTHFEVYSDSHNDPGSFEMEFVHKRDSRWLSALSTHSRGFPKRSSKLG